MRSAILALAALAAVPVQAESKRTAAGAWGGKTQGAGHTADVKLAKVRRVIAVDLQGHGRTADVDRPLSVEAMAEDIAALIRHLELDRPDLMGYSLGGGVALQTALRHPELAGKLVVVSTALRRDAFYPEILAQQSAGERRRDRGDEADPDVPALRQRRASAR